MKVKTRPPIVYVTFKEHLVIIMENNKGIEQDIKNNLGMNQKELFQIRRDLWIEYILAKVDIYFSQNNELRFPLGSTKWGRYLATLLEELEYTELGGGLTFDPHENTIRRVNPPALSLV